MLQLCQRILLLIEFRLRQRAANMLSYRIRSLKTSISDTHEQPHNQFLRPNVLRRLVRHSISLPLGSDQREAPVHGRRGRAPRPGEVTEGSPRPGLAPASQVRLCFSGQEGRGEAGAGGGTTWSLSRLASARPSTAILLFPQLKALHSSS